MVSTNVYRLHFPLLQRIMLFGTMGILSLVGAGLIVAATLNRRSEGLRGLASVLLFDSPAV